MAESSLGVAHAALNDVGVLAIVIDVRAHRAGPPSGLAASASQCWVSSSPLPAAIDVSTSRTHTILLILI